MTNIQHRNMVITQHIRQRMDERGVQGWEVVETLRKPQGIQRVEGEPDQRKYWGKNGVCVVVSYSSYEANLVTVFRRNRDDSNSTTEASPQGAQGKTATLPLR